MSTITAGSALADLEGVCRAGEPDPAVLQRIRERSQKVQEELRRRFGTVALAVPLLREVLSDE